MKIIKKGKISDRTKVLRTKCVVCRTVYDFTEFECDWVDFDSGNVKCPLCGYTNRVDVDVEEE